MRILELNKYRQARVWIGDLPDVGYPSVETLSYSIAAGGESQGHMRVAAVEVLVHTGPRYLYGLLGGQWKANATGTLSILVKTSTANERLFADSLAKKLDHVRAGLPAEYAQGVLSGAHLAKDDLGVLSAGELSVNCAAHGAIGSCQAVYKHLTAILLKLFNGAGSGSSDQELIKLFPSTYS